MAAIAAEEQNAYVEYLDVEFVDDVSEFQCVRCERVLFQHYISNCGHAFCANCKRILDDGSHRWKCPRCQEYIRDMDIQNEDFKNKLLELDVHCPNKKYGCKFIDQLKKIQDHLRNCEDNKDNNLPKLLVEDGNANMNLEQMFMINQRFNMLNEQIDKMSEKIIELESKDKENETALVIKFEDIKSIVNGSRSDMKEEINRINIKLNNIKMDEAVEECKLEISNLKGKSEFWFEILEFKEKQLNEAISHLRTEFETKINNNCKILSNEIEKKWNEIQNLQLILTELNTQIGDLNLKHKNEALKVEMINEEYKTKFTLIDLLIANLKTEIEKRLESQNSLQTEINENDLKICNLSSKHENLITIIDQVLNELNRNVETISKTEIQVNKLNDDVNEHEDKLKPIITKPTNISVNIAHEDNATPLQLASSMGQEDVVNFFLDHGAIINETTEKEKWTALHLAAEYGHINIVQLLLKKGANVNATLSNEATPLHLAAQNGHNDVVEFLLLNGANVNATYLDDKITALHVAAKIGNCDLAISLLKSGGNIDALDANDKTPLHYAAAYDQCDIIPVLCEFKSDVNAKDAKQWTAMHVAAEKGFFQFIIKLYNCGAKVYELTDTGWSAMHIACQNGHSNVTRTLLLLDKQSILINQAGFKGESPLQVAADSGHSESVQMLMENGGNINHSDSIGFTALLHATIKGHEDTVQCLIRNKADAELGDTNGDTPLHFATALGHQAIVRMLCNAGASVNSVTLSGYTPLHYAAEKNYVDIASTLIEKEAEVNAMNEYRYTPLYLAAQRGHFDMVKLLVKAGANVNCKTNNDSTPLQTAAEDGHTDIIKLLLENGAEIDATRKRGFTALHLAVKNGHVDSIKALLTFHANVFSINDDNSILHQAVKNEQVLKLVLAKIKSKSDGERLRLAINAEDKNGNTPLICASDLGNVNSIKLLLQCENVDINSHGFKNVTALHYAVENGHFEAVETLIQNGADVFAMNDHESVLHQAVRNDDILRLVIREMRMKRDGDDLKSAMNAEDGEGDTPLMWTAERGFLSSAQLLLECEEVDINRRGFEGRTALHWAAQIGHLSVAELLIANKADVSVKDNNGATALELARKRMAKDEKYESIAKLILSVTEDT